jgi:hypothetical protein
MNQTEFSTKTTLIDIEEKQDKNSHPYFKITAHWGLNSQVLYAFSTDFQLNKETLHTLTTAPENLINRLVLITYQAQVHKDNHGSFYKVKALKIIE